MSQAKVDRYKEEKRNREKIMKKQKMEWMATKICLSLVGLVMVAWIGVSVYNVATNTETDTTTAELPGYTVNTTALDEFMNDILVD